MVLSPRYSHRRSEPNFMHFPSHLGVRTSVPLPGCFGVQEVKIQQSDLLFGQSRCAVQTRKLHSPGHLVPVGKVRGPGSLALSPGSEWPGRLSIPPSPALLPHKLSHMVRSIPTGLQIGARPWATCSLLASVSSSSDKNCHFFHLSVVTGGIWE